MPSVKDVKQSEFTKVLAAHLKKQGKLEMPANYDIIKLGKFNELAPYDIDWFYTRTASIARHLYCRSPCGVGALTKVYGGKKNNGTIRSHYCRGYRGVARKALKQLMKIGLVETHPKGGRQLSKQGRKTLDQLAQGMVKKHIATVPLKRK